MMDLRYHLVSLTAVFLALTVGIVVGSSLGSSERQTTVVQRLEEEFERLREEDARVRAENQALRRRLAAREQATRELMPALIEDLVPGVRLALVICGDGFGGDTANALRRSLTLAGAEVTSTTRLPGGLGPIPAELRSMLAGDEGAQSPEQEPRAAARVVVRTIISGDSDGKLRELARATGAVLEGTYRPPVRRLLVILAPPSPSAVPPGAPSAGAAAHLAEAALAAAGELGARVLAADTEEPAAESFLRHAAERQVPAIDDVDTAAGQVALVLKLAAARDRSGIVPGSIPAQPER